MHHNNIYTLSFIASMTIVVSFLLSLTYTQLKDREQINIQLDKKKNILKSIAIDVSKMNIEMVSNEYKNRIKDIVIDLQGNVMPNFSHSDLQSVENKSTGEVNYYKDNAEYLLAYESSNPQAFIMPISGKGLWSTLYGYFALKKDYNTIRGITFYKHGETAGLGGEVEKDWFRRNFIGKQIFNSSGKLTSITVVKGKAIDVLNNKSIVHGVDGISGATITSKGVTNFLKRDLNRYKAYFNMKRNI